MLIEGVEIDCSGFRIDDEPTEFELKKCVKYVNKNKKQSGKVEKIIVKQDYTGKDIAHYYLEDGKHTMILKNWRNKK